MRCNDPRTPLTTGTGGVEGEGGEGSGVDKGGGGGMRCAIRVLSASTKSGGPFTGEDAEEMQKSAAAGTQLHSGKG